MKHPLQIFLIAIVVLAGGCSAPASPFGAQASPSPHSTLHASPPPGSSSALPAFPSAASPSPEGTAPSPVETVPATSVYESENLGLTFTVPDSWVGKYRVTEGDEYLTVWFIPLDPAASGGSGPELFTVMTGKCREWGKLRREWEFDLGGVGFGWGQVRREKQPAEDPDSAYIQMRGDIPDVFSSLRSLSGQTPESVKTLWVETVPAKTDYATTMGLGIAFSIPESWIGKCRIVETADSVAVFFMPKEPVYSKGWLFTIEFKNEKTLQDEATMGNVCEFTENGVTYIWGGPASEYDGPESDAYIQLREDFDLVYLSIRPLR